MSSAFRRTLPARPGSRAAEEAREGAAAAFPPATPKHVARVRAELPDKPTIALADAQFVLAREYGFASWARAQASTSSSAQPSSAPPDRADSSAPFSARDATHVRALLERHADAARGDRRADLLRSTRRRSSPCGERPRRWSTCCSSSAPIRIGAAIGGRAASIRCTSRTAPRPSDCIAAGAVPDACAAAHLDRIDLLAAMLAEDPARVHERGGDGQTPLHFARSRAVVDLLLDAGADIDARDVDHRSTPAEWMLGHDRGVGRYELARYLVERGASADIFLAAALGLTDRARAMLEARPVAARAADGAGRLRRAAAEQLSHLLLDDRRQPLAAGRRGAVRTGRRRCGDARACSTPLQRLLLACRRGDEARRERCCARTRGIVAIDDAGRPSRDHRRGVERRRARRRADARARLRSAHCRPRSAARRCTARRGGLSGNRRRAAPSPRCRASCSRSGTRTTARRRSAGAATDRGSATPAAITRVSRGCFSTPALDRGPGTG